MHIKKIISSIMFVILYLVISFSSLSADKYDETQIMLKAHTAVFHACLEEIKEEIHYEPPTIFLIYSWDAPKHQQRVETLAKDLVRSGIPVHNIYYDQWINGPVSIFQYLDKLLTIDRVIVVGSPELKKQSEKSQGILSQEISILRSRLSSRGAQGVIPVWFEEKYEENFPLALQALAALSLADDYFKSFFDLLIGIYQLAPVENRISRIQEKFIRMRNIPKEMLIRYGERLLETQKAREEDTMLGLERAWKAITDRVPIHNLPDRPSTFFESTSKESDKSCLTLLWEELHLTGAATLSTAPCTAVLAGMGGIGKTYLALQYAYEALEYKAYHLIYWLSSDTEDSLMEGYKNLLHEIAPEISIKGADDDRIIRLINQLISNKGKCLLIYDNVPHPDFLRNKVPQTGVDILITSRCSQGWRKPPISLDVFKPEESVMYLLNMIGLEPIAENKVKAEAIAQELGYLPLALSHAASYIKYIGGGSRSSDILERYLEDFKKESAFFHLTHHKDPFSKQPEMSYEHLVAKTWSLSGKRISDSARQLMVYFAYLDPDLIASDTLLGCVKDGITLDKAFAQLSSFALIKPSQSFFSIHRLTQLAIRKEQESKGLNELLPSFHTMLSSFDMHRESMEQALTKNLELSNLEKMYMISSSLSPNLKTLDLHMERLSTSNNLNETEYLKLQFGIKALQELFETPINSLRGQMRTKLIQAKSEKDRKKLEAAILKDELETKKIALDSELSEKIADVLPGILALNLSNEDTIYIAEIIAKIAPLERHVFVNTIQDILRPGMSSIEQADIIRPFCRMDTDQRREFIGSIKPFLDAKIEGKERVAVMNFLYRMDPDQHREFVKSLQPLLASEMTGKDWYCTIEAFSKMGSRQCCDLINTLQPLFAHGLEKDTWIRIILHLVSIASEKRVDICEKFVFLWALLQKTEKPQNQDGWVTELMNTIIENEGAIGIINICLQINLNAHIK